MNTISKMTAVCILAVLVVVISSSRYGMIKVNAQEEPQFQNNTNDPCAQPPSQQQEQACQESLQKQDCQMLKSKMSGDNEAAKLYKSKDCAGLLGQ